MYSLIAHMPGILKLVNDNYWTGGFCFLARQAPKGVVGGKRTILESFEATTDCPGTLIRYVKTEAFKAYIEWTILNC
jgi:hypothetical protein